MKTDKTDFTSQAFMSDPSRAIAELRSKGPLIKVRIAIMGEVWTTTTQEAAAAVLKDNRNFSMRKPNGKVMGTQWWMPRMIFTLSENMLSSDEPDHTRLRSLVDKAFRRDVILALESKVQAMADRLAKELFNDAQQADFVSRFAKQLPLEVICELLGLPENDRKQFSEWADGFTRVNGIFDFLKAMWPIRKLRNYLEREIARQKVDGGKGLLADLLQMQSDGAEISDDEVLAMAFLLLLAGHETTTHALSGGLMEILRTPNQLGLLVADMETHVPLTVEEILRFVSAVQFTKPRNVARDCEVLGVSLKKGEAVLPMLVAANYDEAVNANAAMFDISRKPNRHMAFGGGIHFCLGHQLARMEIACALKALFTAYPDLALAHPNGPFQWRSRVGIRALEELPLLPTAQE